jgi:parvin
MASSSVLNASTKSEGPFPLIGTLGRSKKKQKELEQWSDEARNALDSPTANHSFDLMPEDYILNELDERRMLEPGSANAPALLQLQRVLIDWLNDELADQRIVVRSLEQDLHDGQILGKLIERLTNCRLPVVELTQNEDLQRTKLLTVLQHAHEALRWPNDRETLLRAAERVQQRDLVHVLHLLIGLVRQFRPPVRLPVGVTARLVVVQKRDGKLHSRVDSETLTLDDPELNVESSDDCERLLAGCSVQLNDVKRQIREFVCLHLYRLNIDCETDDRLELTSAQFADGLLLVFLIGSCAGFFVPLSSVFTTPNEDALEQHVQAGLSVGATQLRKGDYVNSVSMHKLHNVNVAFDLMEDSGINVSSICD